MGRKARVSVEGRETSIRLKFTWDGERRVETLRVNGAVLQNTTANIKRADRTAAEIQRHLDNGTFTADHYVDFFPDSDFAKARAKVPNSLGVLLNLWHESQGRLTGATKDQYGTAVRFWKRLLGEATLVREITHKVLAAKIGGYPWPSPKTHNNYLIALRGAFHLEYRGPDSVRNPLIGIENMPVVKKLPDPLTIDERDAILADIKAHYDERVYAYFLFAFFTGMRPEEMIALRWSDIDWQAQCIRVQRVRTFKGSERDGSKTHSERDVDLVQQALAALAIMSKHTKMLKPEDREDGAADIFQNPVTKRAWHDERSQRDHYWRPALKRLKIRWRRPYNTRHTYATVALMGRVPVAYIAAQLGHSVKMLLDKYARWIPANDDGAARAQLSAAMGADVQSQRKVANE